MAGAIWFRGFLHTTLHTWWAVHARLVRRCAGKFYHYNLAWRQDGKTGGALIRLTFAELCSCALTREDSCRCCTPVAPVAGGGSAQGQQAALQQRLGVGACNGRLPRSAGTSTGASISVTAHECRTRRGFEPPAIEGFGGLSLSAPQASACVSTSSAQLSLFPEQIPGGSCEGRAPLKVSVGRMLQCGR